MMDRPQKEQPTQDVYHDDMDTRSEVDFENLEESASSLESGVGSESLMTSQEFFDLLRHRTSENAHQIDQQIDARGLQKLTVLMSDSSGFSRKTHQFGILQFLAIMTQSHDKFIELIVKNRGVCLSEGADNVLAIFSDPGDAIQSAIEMHLRLRQHNQGLPEAEQFNICVGIHFGMVVRLADDVYGDTVNIAAKVGEDLASKDEILVTSVVMEHVKDRYQCEYSRATELGGRTFDLYRVVY